MPHLWEIDHPYLCFTAESVESRYKSWGAFEADYKDADFDYNLLFRFDWHEGEGHDLEAFNGDPNYRNGELLIFWMGQRKGLYRYSVIEVCRNDEVAVIEFLRPRWNHMRALWSGVSDWRESGPP